MLLHSQNFLWFYPSWLSCHNPMSLQPSVRAPAPAQTQPQFIRIRWQPVPSAPPESGHCSPTMEQNQLSEAARLLQGHSGKSHPSGGDTSLSFWFFGCWHSALSEHLLLLLHWVSFRLSRSKDENMFWCLLLPAPPEKPLHFLWAAEQLWPKDTLCPSLSEASLQFPAPHSESPAAVAFLWISSCAYGHFPILSFQYPRTKGKLQHLLCSLWKWWRKGQTKKKLIWL